MIAAYLAGLPGAGKSTLLRHLTAGLDRIDRRKPFAHALYLDASGSAGAVQLGDVTHAAFPGTDRLSMGVSPTAIDFVASAPAPVLVAEGDRLTSRPFLTALAAHADAVLVLLDVDDAEAARRRLGRAASTPSRSWLQGRATKLRNLADNPPLPLVRLDGSLRPEQLAAEAIDRVPAFARLAALRSG